MKNKNRSVVYLKKLDNNKIAILPFAVLSARGRTFTGNDCQNCIVMEAQQWQQMGLKTIIEILLAAPIKQNETLEKWEGVPRSTIFDAEWKKQNPKSNPTKNAIRVETWIETDADNTPKHGKVSVYPSWSPYYAREVFAFMKVPANEVFLEHTNRLFG